MMRMSMEGLNKLTKPWEEFVAYPYDDKVAPQIHAGKRVYFEYEGGPVRGTITQGYGHTDAAGAPKIEVGHCWTEEYADQVLLDDMAPCERMVNAALHVAVTQHQFDTLCDITFNCPSALPHLASLINAGNWPAAERLMLQFVYSKGERMVGLVHRRNAEIAWANTPDEVSDVTLPTASAAPTGEIFSPKAEREPQPKPTVQSKQVVAGGTVGAGGLYWIIDKLNQAAAPLEEAKGHLETLGLFDQFVKLAHSPMAGVAIGVAIIGLAVFIVLDRRSKLINDHV